MTATKMIVTAEAWTRVSRSGHWTFFSSAQQEAMKPMTPPRRFSAFSACAFWSSLGAGLAALLLLALLCARGAPRGSRRGSSVGASVGAPTSAREGAGASGPPARADRRRGDAGDGRPRPRAAPRRRLDRVLAVVLGRAPVSITASASATSPETRGLGVVLGLRSSAAARRSRASGWRSRWRCARGLRFSAFRCARVFGQLASLLVRGVAAAPAAVLAHLDPVRRVPPRLVRLVVAALALLASEGHADSHV